MDDYLVNRKGKQAGTASTGLFGGGAGLPTATTTAAGMFGGLSGFGGATGSTSRTKLIYVLVFQENTLYNIINMKLVIFFLVLNFLIA